MNNNLNTQLLTFIENDLVMITTFLCAVLFFVKINNLKLNRKQYLFTGIAIIILPTICECFGGYRNLILKILYFLTLCFVLSLLDRKRLHSSILISIISVCVSYGLEYVCILISSTFFYFVGYINGNILTTIPTCILQIVLCWLINKIKWIHKSLTYFSDKNNFGLALLISAYILLFYLVISIDDSENIYLSLILLFCTPLALMGLILWIRSIVQHYYKNRLKDRADAFTQQEIREKDEKIERLEAEVATLAKQLHRDNHLLSSLDRSVQTLGKTESAAEREQLVGEIRTMYRERNDLIAKEQQESKLLPSTGIALIDGALSEMYVKATAHGIGFDLIVGEPIHYLVNNIISQTDLQTLLCDHIKDAIIAVSAAGIANGSILVAIKKIEGIFEISIHDNGVDFTPDTLAKLGKERVTTHADEGGSGIGFMTTFETLEKTKGSLIITEYENKSPFSKAITFSFDGLHRFIIRSDRKEELKSVINRDDVIYI